MENSEAIKSVRARIQKNQEESRAMNKAIALSTGKERQAIREAKKALGRKTRADLLSLCILRGKPLYTQEVTRKNDPYLCNTSAHLDPALEPEVSYAVLSEARKRNPQEDAKALYASRLERDHDPDFWSGVHSAVQEAYRQVAKDAVFEQGIKGESTTHLSPCGKYKLEVIPYATRPGCWGYTMGVVTTVEGRGIAEVRRNYSAFPFAWVPNHENGHSYLVCGENYQGYTVIELDTRGRRDYLPREAKVGFGFCWATINPSPDGKHLAVEGCYWACPYETRIYDFTDPLHEVLLLKEHDDPSRYDEFVQWIDNRTYQVGKKEDFCLTLGKFESEMTQEELETIANSGDEASQYVEGTKDSSLCLVPTYAAALDAMVKRYTDWLATTPAATVTTTAYQTMLSLRKKVGSAVSSDTLSLFTQIRERVSR